MQASPKTYRSLSVAVAVALAGALMALFASGRASATEATASVTPPAAIKHAGKIVFCIDWTNPPMEFNTGSATPKGSDPDTGAAIAAMMGVKAQWLYLGFDGLIAALEGGKCDAILSGMNDTALRRKVVDFVDYASVGDVVMVRKAQEHMRITSLTQLSGKRMAVQVGTTEYEQIQAANKTLAAEGKPQIGLVYLTKSADAIADLVTGKTDADFNQAPAEAYAISKAPPNTFAIVSGSIGAAPIGIATRKNDPQLHASIAHAVARIYADGKMCSILKYWHMETLVLPGQATCK